MATAKQKLRDLRRSEIERQKHARLAAASPAGKAARKTIAGASANDYDGENWDDRDTRAVHADAALILNHGLDDALINAFAAFDIDPKNPYHWKRLARYLAAALFERRPGAPLKWDASRLRALLSAADEMKQQDPKTSDRSACDKLAKLEVFNSIGSDMLRKKLTLARKKSAGSN